MSIVAPASRLSNRAILSAWEDGQQQPAVGRTLVMLQCAYPNGDQEAFASWTVGRRDAALLDIHEATFGTRIEGTTASPCCGEQLDLTFSIADIRSAHADDDREFELVVEEGAFRLLFRVPTCADLFAAAGCEDDKDALGTIVERCVLAGQRASQPIGMAELPDQVVDVLGDAMAQHDPQSDVRLDVTCPSCSHAWQVWFDIGQFLWQKITARARQLAGDVHALALTYKWTEEDILSLSETRRQMYLDLVL